MPGTPPQASEKTQESHELLAQYLDTIPAQASIAGAQNRLRPVSHLELAKDIGDMVAHCFQADRELAGNLWILLAAHNQGQHLALAFGFCGGTPGRRGFQPPASSLANLRLCFGVFGIHPRAQPRRAFGAGALVPPAGGAPLGQRLHLGQPVAIRRHPSRQQPRHARIYLPGGMRKHPPTIERRWLVQAKSDEPKTQQAHLASASDIPQQQAQRTLAPAGMVSGK